MGKTAAQKSEYCFALDSSTQDTLCTSVLLVPPRWTLHPAMQRDVGVRSEAASGKLGRRTRLTQGTCLVSGKRPHTKKIIPTHPWQRAVKKLFEQAQQTAKATALCVTEVFVVPSWCLGCTPSAVATCCLHINLILPEFDLGTLTPDSSLSAFICLLSLPSLPVLHSAPGSLPLASGSFVQR